MGICELRTACLRRQNGNCALYQMTKDNKMVAQLNHLIIRARDKEKAARFLARILGLEVGPQ
jgi:hypothetical protein